MVKIPMGRSILAMKLVMSEDSNEALSPRLCEMKNDEDSMCINIFENNEDVELLKSHAKGKVHVDLVDSSDDSVDGDLACAIRSTHLRNDNVNNLYRHESEKPGINGDGSRFSSHPSKVNGSAHHSIGIENISQELANRLSSPNDAPSTLSTGQANIAGENVSCTSAELNHISRTDFQMPGLTTQLADTVLVSHPPTVRLTEDIPLNVTENNNRFSRVLENIPLVYIPTTKQLGLAKHADGAKVTNCNSEIQNPTCVTSKDEEFPCKYINSEHLDPVPNLREYESSLQDDNRAECSPNSPMLGHNPQTKSYIDCDITETSSIISSVSSISTGTDYSTSPFTPHDDILDCHTEPDGFTEVNLHSRNTYELSSHKDLLESALEDHGAKPKRRPLSGLRNLFSKKPKDSPGTTTPGWKLFGRVPPKPASSVGKDHIQISQDYHRRASLENTCVPTATRGKKQDIEVLSTTALILENRPLNLPSKTREEELKHKLEYEEMVEAAKKKKVPTATLL